MKVKFIIALLTIAFTHVSVRSTGQVYITGPGCVTTGIEYQYMINGNRDSGSTMQVCIQNGVISSEQQACISGGSLSYIRVLWNRDALQGTVSVTSASGNASFTSTIAPALNPGQVDSSNKRQALDTVTTPRMVKCTGARGGSCNPSYSYQWQQSFDNIRWADIADARGQDLTFTKPLKRTTFYRRKVVENTSTSIGYSSVAAIIIHRAL
jgi:hypothetical protein